MKSARRPPARDALMELLVTFVVALGTLAAWALYRSVMGWPVPGASFLSRIAG